MISPVTSGGGRSGSTPYECCNAETERSIPSSCTVFVYREATSIEVKRHSFGNVRLSRTLMSPSHRRVADT